MLAGTPTPMPTTSASGISYRTTADSKATRLVTLLSPQLFAPLVIPVSAHYTARTIHVVEHILTRHFPEQRWRIMTPPAGVQKEAYVAQSDQHKLFVKFDAATPAWPRLADLGVTPPLLGLGTHYGRPYIIQPFVEGAYPDRKWFAQNTAVPAHFVNRYHNDEQLTKILSAPGARSYPEHIEQEVSAIEDALTVASLDMFSTSEFCQAFELFKQQAGQLRPAACAGSCRPESRKHARDAAQTHHDRLG